MRIYQAKHWNEDSPKDKRYVLVGVFQESEMRALTEAQLSGEEEQFISKLISKQTNKKYHAEDFSAYFCEDEGDFSPGNIVEVFGDYYKIEEEIHLNES